MDNDQSIFLIVYVDGKAVGFTQLYKLYHYIKLAKQWLLSDLFVHPDYRGKGLSVALIDRAKQWCDETGACGLMLETEKTNDIGNKLYPRCGFEYDGSTIITIGGNKENMIAVIFEVYPKTEKVEEYLDIAQELKPELVKFRVLFLSNAFKVWLILTKSSHSLLGK